MKYIIAVVMAITLVICPASAVLAISNPDSTPTLEDVWVFRNVLETADTLVIALENTPYATTPTDYTYSNAFVWRFMDGDNETAQVEGYDYNESGYGYNVIAFYFDAATAPTWLGDYDLRLSGKPSAFADPPHYTFPIPVSAYSALTDTDEVKAAIANLVIDLANDLYVYWGLNYLTTLVEETETATVLSLAGQSFFRGAIYGLQGMAPAAFAMTVVNLDVTDRTWTTGYSDNLTAQHTGSYIGTGFDAGEDFFGTDYNLLGMLITLAIGGGLLFANWYIAGGNVWRGAVEAAAPLVIFTRMGVFGLGELCLIAALCWIYVNARIWKMV